MTTKICVRTEITTDTESQRYLFVPHLRIPQNVCFHGERLTESYRVKKVVFSQIKYACLQNVLLESENIFL
jgi:hypothetical protein